MSIDYLAKWITLKTRSKCKTGTTLNEEGHRKRNRSSASLLRQLVKICICESVLKAIDMCSLHPILLPETFKATPKELFYILSFVHGRSGYKKDRAKQYFEAVKSVILGKGPKKRYRDTMSSVLSDELLEPENGNEFIIIFIFYLAHVIDLVKGGMEPFNEILVERRSTVKKSFLWKSSTDGESSPLNETSNISQFRISNEFVSLTTIVPMCCKVFLSDSIDAESASEVHDLDIDFWERQHLEAPVEPGAGPSGGNNDLCKCDDLVDSESEGEGEGFEDWYDSNIEREIITDGLTEVDSKECLDGQPSTMSNNNNPSGAQPIINTGGENAQGANNVLGGVARGNCDSDQSHSTLPHSNNEGALNNKCIQSDEGSSDEVEQPLTYSPEVNPISNTHDVTKDQMKIDMNGKTTNAPISVQTGITCSNSDTDVADMMCDDDYDSYDNPSPKECSQNDHLEEDTLLIDAEFNAQPGRNLESPSTIQKIIKEFQNRPVNHVAPDRKGSLDARKGGSLVTSEVTNDSTGINEDDANELLTLLGTGNGENDEESSPYISLQQIWTTQNLENGIHFSNSAGNGDGENDHESSSHYMNATSCDMSFETTVTHNELHLIVSVVSFIQGGIHDLHHDPPSIPPSWLSSAQQAFERRREREEAEQFQNAEALLSFARQAQAEELLQKIVCQLSDREESIVRSALDGVGESAVSQGTNIVQIISMQTLKPERRLNDEIINYFFRAVLARWEKMLCTKQSGSKRSLFLSSFFAQKMHDDKNNNSELRGRYNYDNVKSWMKGKDIFSSEHTFIPVNIANKHWTLMVILMEKKEIRYYDSLPVSNKTKESRATDNMFRMIWLLQYLEDEFENNNTHTLDRFNKSEWTLVDCSMNTPKQTNGKFTNLTFTLCNIDFYSSSVDCILKILRRL